MKLTQNLIDFKPTETTMRNEKMSKRDYLAGRAIILQDKKLGVTGKLRETIYICEDYISSLEAEIEQLKQASQDLIS